MKGRQDMKGLEQETTLNLVIFHVFYKHVFQHFLQTDSKHQWNKGTERI